MKPIIKGILLQSIPMVISVIALLYIDSSKTPETVYHSYAQQTNSPAYYDVVASPHYKMTHGAFNTTLVIIGFVLYVAGIVIIILNLKFGLALILTIVSWLGGLLCIFGKYSFHYYDETKYEKTITVDQYENNKTDLDIIFDHPEIHQ